MLGALVGFWIFHGLFGIGDTNNSTGVASWAR